MTEHDGRIHIVKSTAGDIHSAFMDRVLAEQQADKDLSLDVVSIEVY